MDKVKEFIRNVFSIRNLLTGLIGWAVGMFFYVIGRIVDKSTFVDIAIFIGVGLGFTVVIFLLGHLLNKTLLKDDN